MGKGARRARRKVAAMERMLRSMGEGARQVKSSEGGRIWGNIAPTKECCSSGGPSHGSF